MSLKKAWHELIGKPKPKTRIATGGTKQNYFSERGRDREQLKKYETIYNQGGIISEAVDCYAMFALSNDWRLEGEYHPVQQVQEFIDQIDFESIMWEAITDCIVFGDAFQENIFSRGSEFVSIAPRLARTFDIIYDDFGEISGYEQNTGDEFGTEHKVELEPSQITHLQLFRLGGSMYGQSLISRAYDDIMRDTKTSEATAIAIERHGFRKYHIKVGLEGEDIPQEVLTNIDKEFQKLKTNNEMVTSHDVDIGSIDVGGIEKVDTYSDISIMRMAAAMGVPEELLGLRRGSTDATAGTRIDVFFKKISTIQRKVARCYEQNVFDLIVAPGSVKLVFEDISPADEAAKAKWIAEIMKSTPMDPFCVLPQAWIKEQFNIDPDAYDEEEPYIEEVEPAEVTDETIEDDTEKPDTDNYTPE